MTFCNACMDTAFCKLYSVTYGLLGMYLCSYEQLVQLHPDVEDYKLYYAQVHLHPAASLTTVAVVNFSPTKLYNQPSGKDQAPWFRPTSGKDPRLR